MNNITGIQRRRRLAAEQEAIAAAKATEIENEEEEEIENEGEVIDPIDPPKMDDTVLTEAQVDAMTIEELQEELTKRDVKFAHNAGEENLKGKLKDAIAGA